MAMFQGLYRIGGKRIQILSLHEWIHEYCKDYAENSESPDLSYDIKVAILPEDLEYEKDRCERDTALEGRKAENWPEEYLETLAVYRKIAEQMPGMDTFLFHGSAVAADGEGYLFTAKSGTGKSTHVKLWRKMLGSRTVMINDDKPLIHVNGDGSALVYGTPWNGKHHLGNNISVPLKAICILERDRENHIERIQKKEVYPMLLQQAYRPADPVSLAQTLQLIDRLDTAFYRLGCNMDPEAAEISYEGMKGKRL